MIPGQPVRQIAYAVNDVREFATQHSERYGSGPFLIIEGAELTGNLRGTETKFTIDVAFGQWGEMQLELMHQRSAAPGLITDLFPEGSTLPTVHHMCSIVNDLNASLAEFEAAGCDVVFTGTMPLGTQVAMVDTARQLGHYTELYEYSEEIRWLYEAVHSASVDFDGTRPVRDFGEYTPSELQIQN